MHQDGDGYNIVLQALPLDGKIVLRPVKDKTAEQPQEQPAKSNERRATRRS